MAPLLPRRGVNAADGDKAYRVLSPLRGRRPPQESRPNHIRRSCSPPGDSPPGRNSSSPLLSHQSPRGLLPTTRAQLPTPDSPSDKNWSCTSSLSLSPSPERTGEPARRVKSPLRVRKRLPAEYGGGGLYGEASCPPLMSLTSAVAAAAMDDAAARKLKRRKERARAKKCARARGPGGDEPLPARGRDKECLATLSSSQPSTTSTESSGFASVWEAASSVLEARRRKFESSVPIESSNKRIRLKMPATEARDATPEEDNVRAAPTSAASCEPANVTEDLEKLLDLELQNAMQLWSDDDSDSDNEARFKTAGAGSANVPKIRLVPLSILQGLDSGPLEKPERGRQRPVAVEDREHLLHMPVRGSRKESRNTRIQERMKLKDGNSEKEIYSSSDQEQKRSKIRLASDLDDVEELGDSGKDGDLRAALSRRRAERLTMAGSVHEILPARLVQSAFKDAVGKKNFRRLERERHGVSKRPESQKGETGDGRRVLVLKSSPVEQQIPSISVTIPKEEKHKRAGSPVSGGKVPIHMRLGLPGGGGSFPEERERPSGVRRRTSRKVKLKRNVLLASPAGEKVMCGSSLSLTLGSMRHSLLCSLPTFLSPIYGLLGLWSSIRAQLYHTWKLSCSVW